MLQHNYKTSGKIIYNITLFIILTGQENQIVKKLNLHVSFSYKQQQKIQYFFKKKIRGEIILDIPLDE